MMVCRDHRVDMADEWVMRRCSGCYALYLDPRPDPESLPAAYDTYYTHQHETEAVPGRGGGRLLWGFIHGYLNARFGLSRRPASALGKWLFGALPPWRMKLDHYGRHLFADLHPERGALLDIGCGNGTFIARAAEMGWRTTGLDPDLKAIAVCREQGLEAIQGTLPFLPAELENRFDVVTLSHSIEHVSDPLAALQSVAEALRDGGKVWMALPNPQSMGARFFGAAWRGLHPPFHLCIPSQPQLVQMLNAAGFDDVKLLNRGAHARQMMAESADNARTLGGAGMRMRALLAPALRMMADILATVSPRYSEETVIIATRKARQ